MTDALTSRISIYGVIAVVGIVGGLGLGRPEVVAIGVAALLVVVAGLSRTRDIALRVEVGLERDRAIEGDDVAMSVVISADDPIGRLEVAIALPEGLDLGVVADATGNVLRVEQRTVVVRIDRDEPARLRVAVGCAQWGGYQVGKLRLSAESVLGVRRLDASTDAEIPLKVFPPEDALRELLEPVETQLNLGELVSRRTGGGIEFADLRAFMPGDDPRRINWRASTRRGSLWINERHPERNSDIILLIDTLMGRSSHGTRLLDYAVRAAASISSSHLGRRDRVGLLVMGGPLLWLRPRMFDLQRNKILDALAQSRLRASYWQGMVAVPRRFVPPKAMLVALTPLLEAQAIEAFDDLIGRGHDLAIIEVVIDASLPPPETAGDQLARRIWNLERDSMRRRYRRAGVALARWDPVTPFETALREVSAFRRAMGRAPI